MPALKKIYADYFSDDYPFESFFNQSMLSFAVLNEANEIITACSVRPLLEVITLTDKSKIRGKRYRAFSKILDVCSFFAKNKGFDSIHAFVGEPYWERHLKKIGFVPIQGTGLIFHIEETNGKKG